MPPTVIVIPAVAALTAAPLALWRAVKRGGPWHAGWAAALEVACTVFLGALIARTSVWCLLAAFDFSDPAVRVVGWLFLFWPGVVDAISFLVEGRAAFTAGALADWACALGGLVGFWDGLHRIHDWQRWGLLTFVSDITWGAAAVSIGVVCHFLNLGWAKYVSSERVGAHRYASGVRAATGYAITVGNVCGNLGCETGGSLFRHEAIHVLQNRIFGPFYLYSYVAWAVLLAIPAFLWGSLRGRPRRTVFSWSYCNNPWEDWAYRHGGSRDPRLVWPAVRKVAVVVLVSSLVAVAAAVAY